MDIGEIEVRIPSVSDINDQITEFVKDYVCKKTSSVLIKVSQEHNLPRDKLMSYIHQIEFDDISTTLSAKRPRKKVETKDRCLAKTSKGGQCTRKRKTDYYCGSHENSRPYGLFCIPVPEERNKPLIKLKAKST